MPNGNAAGPGIGAYLAAVQWADEECAVQDFVQRLVLPQVAKIVKGQPLGAGPALGQTVVLAQAGKRLKVAAQCVKFKDGGRVLPVGTKLAIPDSYEGWFEILSEDGRAVRCIESVAELLGRFPETCLVRENVKAHLAKTEDAEGVSDKTRTLAAGETLVLVGEVHVAPHRSKFSGRYLRCFTTKGETVFLGVEQKGKFSPIAGADNISGVHTIKNLLSKRFPLMVRLVHGKPPVGLKSSSHFITEMRLYALFEEESIVILPLLKDAHLIALPPSVQLKVQAPRNYEALVKTKDYELLAEKCKSMVRESSDKIQMFDIALSKELRAEGKPSSRQFFPRIHRVQRSVSDPNGTHRDIATPDPTSRRNSSQENAKANGSGDGYDEIDQIYDYVRGFAPLPRKLSVDFPPAENGHGGKSSSHSASASNSPATTYSAESQDEKPEPPPIETIPVRRSSKDETSPKTPARASELPYSDVDLVEGHIYEKVLPRDSTKPGGTEPSLKTNGPEKHFVPNQGFRKHQGKSSAQNKIQHKYFKQSRSSPAFQGMHIPKAGLRTKADRSKSLTTSPLFDIRYKSLVNLAIDFDTLDSSNSGGRVSSDSPGSRDAKWDRRVKLTRPKSLTDLFTETNQLDCCFKHREFENYKGNGLDNKRFIFIHESSNGKLLNGSHHKRIGTLYL